MTSISGHTLIATPCCKSIYKTPYGFMNLSATGYWTDGAKENSLCSMSGGLRMCRCGTAFLLVDAVKIEIEAGPEITEAEDVNPKDLPRVISKASSPRLEVMARRNYWRQLNDAYRVEYREHQEKKIAFERKLLRRVSYGSLLILQRAVRILRQSEPQWITAKLKRPFTVPPYSPTTEQIDNMKLLLTLIQSGAEEPFEADGTEIVELYRELGQFEKAKEALGLCTKDYQATKKKVIAEQIDQLSNTPMRYRG